MDSKQTAPLIKCKYTTFFRDESRQIDAILVYEPNKTSNDRQKFLQNLKNQSLELEFETSKINENLVFVKVHAPKNVLKKNAQKHGIISKYEQVTKLPEPDVPFDFLKTILNDPNPDPNDPVAKRAWKTISKEKPTDFSNCERHNIVFTMMRYTYFGDEPFQVGIAQLLLNGDFNAAYPLHDGEWEWPENDSEPLNDRQLLARYWANLYMIHKQQPVNVIEKYFGPEVAMYFGWLGFYNQMLFIASFMGILTVLYGVIHLYFFVSLPIKEACESEIYLCPYCRQCKPVKLKKFCSYFRIANLNDNFASVIFACAMSFWATSFMEFWKRTQARFEIRWSMNELEDEDRPEFTATADQMRAHKYTGELELFIPLKDKIMRYSVSITIVLFLIISILATITAIIIYECTLKMYGVEKVLISTSSAILTLFVMMGLRKMYGVIALKLTKAECPRTQVEFDKSYMIKMVVFSFVNNFGKLLYIAFLKGKFFTYPGDPKIRSNIFPLAAETCDPTGCVSEVFVLLATITFFKPIILNCIEFFEPIISIYIKRFKKKIGINTKNLDSWEQDYDLNTTEHYQVMGEVEEMVTQYGFVTLLVAAFPLAPILALLNNIFEIRIDSNKVVKYYRRPESVYSTSISVWFDTLQALTYIAVVTNALFITFTSNFIPTMVYYYHYNKNLEGFYEFDLSKFKITDNYWSNVHNITECYYIGQRYPPGDKNEYQLTYLHYYILSCRLAFTIVFVILVLGLTAIMAYAIPDIPRTVRELLAYNTRKLREKAV